MEEPNAHSWHAEQHDSEILWEVKSSVSVRSIGWVAFATGCLLLGIGLWETSHPTPTSAGPIFLVIAVPTCWYSLAGALLPSLVATTGGVLVRNVVFEYWVPWSVVQNILVAFKLMIVVDDDDRSVDSWAVQKSSIPALFGRRSRADRIADRLILAWNGAKDLDRVGDGRVARRLARWPTWAPVVPISAAVVLGLFALVGAP